MTDKMRKIILDMFHDCDHKHFNSGALECVKVLIGESYIEKAPILKAYIVRNILNTDRPFFIIRYGSEFRSSPKYHSMINKLFESEEDAYKYIGEIKSGDVEMPIGCLFETYGIFEI